MHRHLSSVICLPVPVAFPPFNSCGNSEEFGMNTAYLHEEGTRFSKKGRVKALLPLNTLGIHTHFYFVTFIYYG